MIVARQFIAWNSCENGRRPVRYDRCPGVLVIAFVQRVLGFFTNVVATWYVRGDNSSYRPYGTGRFFFEHIPGNKLPGYDHAVPSGQVPTSPSGTNKPSVRAHIFHPTHQN